MIMNMKQRKMKVEAYTHYHIHNFTCVIERLHGNCAKVMGSNLARPEFFFQPLTATPLVAAQLR